MKIYNHSSVFNRPSTIYLPCYMNFDPDQLRSRLSQFNVLGINHILNVFSAKKNQTEWLYTTDDNIQVLLVGLGESSHIDHLKSFILSATAKHKTKLSEHVVFDLALLAGMDIERSIERLFLGLLLGLKNSGTYKTDQNMQTEFSYGLLTDDIESDALIRSAEKAEVKANSINRIIDLVNAPPNKKNTNVLAEWMAHSAQSFNYQLKVFELEELKELGFDALLAVNQGSPVPAKCMIAEYVPSSKSNVKTVVLVGKGVTFDTGGLSIKGSKNMHYMKSDMGGAAAVMGTIEIVARLQLPVHLVGIVPATDNSVDAMSSKPGDIISSYSGKTIEIIDTDAEGRLILADGLAYGVKHFEADYIIDLATLTGSVIRALGNKAAAIMSHNDNLVQQLIHAGDRTGERLWRLPLWDDYHEMMESDLADIKNLSAKPVAGSITAGKFLEFFIDQHPGWAHLDIAGTAYGSYPTTKGYSATGYGVDLLIEWLEHLV